jgi:hypothetical protein
LSYSQNKFIPGAGNANTYHPEFDLSKMTEDQLTLHVALGSQMVFWNHLVLNTGGRFGLPVYHTSNDPGNFMKRRNASKEYFSVFFGIGVLL